MAAGVHDARAAGGIRHTRPLDDGQCIHVGADGNCTLVGAIAQCSDHAGDGDPRRYLESQFLQDLGHDGRRAVLLELQFRIGVKVPPDGNQLGLEFGNDLLNHRRAGICFSTAAKIRVMMKVRII